MLLSDERKRAREEHERECESSAFHGGEEYQRAAICALSSRELRIFQILEFNQFNTGSVHQMFQAATGLRERGHEVTILSKPDAVLAAKAAENDVRFHGLPFRHPFDFGTVRRLRRLIRE